MTNNALELNGIAKHFGPTRVLERIDLSIVTGERHVIIGPNGAGKSTLMNILSGTLRPTAGAVMLKGRDITGKSPAHIARSGVGRAFQIINVFPRLTVRENVESAVASRQGMTWKVWRSLGSITSVGQRTQEILSLIGLWNRRDVPAGLLAYGEQRRLEIALCLGLDPEVLLLDEPCAGLNAEDSAAATEMLRQVSANKTLVMVEHDMDVVFNLADRVTVLHQGKVLLTGHPEEIRASSAVRAAYLGGHV
jgi:branched-chain amino acid transport system ATP-binding protein